ncbi:MAG: sulfatase [candidate division Zixibacteria bacterium]|nr:sulfatase [candidate division Zixibacteria bacterium]
MKNQSKGSMLLEPIFKSFRMLVLVVILVFTSQLLLSCHFFHKRPNVFLIVVDTLRYDHLGCYGYPRNTSPNIDLLSRESVVFNNAYSQAGWTYPSFASIMTSLYPKDHNVTDWNYKIDTSLTTIAEVLDESGYETYAYPSHFIFADTCGLEQGFDHYNMGVIKMGYTSELVTAPKLNELLLNDIENISEPFFIWAHYFDPHSIYRFHEKFPFGILPADKYDGEIAFTDHHIGKVIEKLKEKKIYDNSIIVFAADHGEELKEHGRSGHRTLWQEVVHIPLIIKAPGLKPKKVNYNVDQIDIAPTILKLAGLDIPMSYQGRDILGDNIVDRPVYIERGGGKLALQKSVIDGHKKLYQINTEFVDTSASRYKTQAYYENQDYMFDLSVDMREMKNLFPASEYDSIKTDLESLFNNFYDGKERIILPGKELDSTTVVKLKALGYIQ